MKITEKTIYTFPYREGINRYTVEIHITRDCFEAYLQKNGFGIKMHLFGVPKVQDGERMTVEEFADMVVGNLKYENHCLVEMYEDEYGF